MTRRHTDPALAQACHALAAYRLAGHATRGAQAAETNVAALARRHGISLLTALRSSHADAQRFRRLERQGRRHRRRARRALVQLAYTPADGIVAIRAKLLAVGKLAEIEGAAFAVLRSAAADLRRKR